MLKDQLMKQAEGSSVNRFSGPEKLSGLSRNGPVNSKVLWNKRVIAGPLLKTNIGCDHT